MALTNAQVQAMVRAGLGRGESRTDQDDLIVQSLNFALDELGRRTGQVSWLELNKGPTDVTLTASQNYFDCSDILTAESLQSYDKIQHIYAMTLINGSNVTPITGMSVRKWGKKIPSHSDTDTEGKPTTYCRIDDRIYLYPVPNSAYEVRIFYSIWPTPIQHSAGTITAGSTAGQASADISLPNHGSMLVAYAVYWAASILGNDALSTRNFGIFEKQLKDALAMLDTKVDNYLSSLSVGGVNEEVSAPGVGAQAGTETWDATYRSAPLGW